MVEKLTPRPLQEEAIARVLAEPTHGALIGDQPGFGKTLIGSEIVARGGFTFGLFIGLKDTYTQWAERVEAQSDGRIRLRRIDGTVAGKKAFADMLAGVDGFYYSGSQYLVRQDWTSVPAFERDGKTPKWKRVTKDNLMTGEKKGDLILNDRHEWEPKRFIERREGEIGPALYPVRTVGPAQAPIRMSTPKHLATYRKKMKRRLDIIVFDEVQMISNRKSNGRRTLGSIKTDWKIAMSGTWFGNSPDNAWTIAYWTWDGKINPETGQPYVGTNFEKWRNEFIATEIVYGKNGKPLETPRGRSVTKVTGEKVPGAFAATLPCYIRRENEEQAPEPTLIYCDPTPQQRAQIEELKRDLMTWVMGWDGEEAPLVVDMPPILAMRLRQVAIAELSYDAEGKVTFAANAASAKLRPLKGLVDHWAGQRVGIFTDSKIGAKFIAHRMRVAGYAAEAYTGDLNEKERASLKARFIAGEVRYLVGTIQSMGTGIDGLQRVCNKLIWVSTVPGNPSLNEQALARYFRQGRTLERGGFEHVEILMNDSVDVESMERLLEKAYQMRESMRIAS